MVQQSWKPRLSFSKIRGQSRRLVIRPYLLSDYEIWRDAHLALLPKQNRFDFGRPKPKEITRAVFSKKVRGVRKQAAKKRLFVFGIFHRKTGQHLGHVDIFMVNPERRWANLGYRIHNQHWNQGYATEAAMATLKIAFGPMNLYRLEAGCELSNRASKRVIQKLGMKREGVRSKFFAAHGGIDMLFFGMNAIDYKK